MTGQKLKTPDLHPSRKRRNKERTSIRVLGWGICWNRDSWVGDFDCFSPPTNGAVAFGWSAARIETTHVSTCGLSETSKTEMGGMLHRKSADVTNGGKRPHEITILRKISGSQMRPAPPLRGRYELGQGSSRGWEVQVPHPIILAPAFPRRRDQAAAVRGLDEPRWRLELQSSRSYLPPQKAVRNWN